MLLAHSGFAAPFDFVCNCLIPVLKFNPTRTGIPEYKCNATGNGLQSHLRKIVYQIALVSDVKAAYAIHVSASFIPVLPAHHPEAGRSLSL